MRTEQARIEILRLAMQLAIELLRDNSGHLGKLITAARIPQPAHPLAVFDAIRAHLSQCLEEQ